MSACLTLQPSALCTGQTGIGNFSGASIMIAEVSSGGTHWGQVGYERNGAYTGCASPQTSQLGTRHTSRVLYSAGCACLRSLVDDVVLDASSFNPFSDWPFDRPWAPQFFAGTGWRESDVPGTASVRLPLASLGAQRFTDDKLENMPCTRTSFNDAPSRWGLASSNCQNSTLWTTVP